MRLGDPLRQALLDRGLGVVAEAFDAFAAALQASYHKEHTVDDAHGTIHASGAITERSRSSAMGVWINVPFASSNFSAPTGSTWTVTQAELISCAYQLVGSSMTIQFYIDTSTLATAAAGTLYLTIPGNLRSTRRIANACAYDDNGTRGTGVVQVRPVSAALYSGLTLELSRDMRASVNWSVSAALSMMGEITFELATSDAVTPPSDLFLAYGGTVTTVGTKTIHTFTGSGSFVVAQGSASVDYLVVGGGGGGGGGYQGGGGGGGDVVPITATLTPGTYAVGIGAKGTGGAGATRGNVGGDSTFNGQTAKGGGYGNTYVAVTQENGGPGGSGGGAAATEVASTGGTASGTNVHAGGAVAAYVAPFSGGGGGGASAAGSAGGAGTGNGGAGYTSSIDGTARVYGSGGGGGSFNVDANGVGGTNAGSGARGTSVNGGSATANFGGGGGGAGMDNTKAGGDGGSGVVIISYTTP